MKSLGQIAYEASAVKLKEKFAVLRWEDLGELTKAAWEAAADAVTAALLKKPAEFAQ